MGGPPLMIGFRLKVRPLLRIALLFLLMGIAAVSAFRASVDGSLEELRVANTQKLELYANSLDSEIGHYARLPSLLGLSSNIDRLLHNPQDPLLQQAANDYLERLTQRTGASAIYIMDTSGIVRATSNWNAPDSYLGENDGFRAYFTDAMSGQPGRFFGVGTTRNEAGYYLSEPMLSRGRIIGVAVVKINMEYLERLWRENKTTVMVSDQNEVVILSTEPGWKFSTLKPFSPALQDAFDRNLQYNHKRLLPLGLEERRSLGDGSHIYRLEQSGRRTLSRLAYPRDMLGQSLQLPAANWRLTVLSSLEAVYQLAYNRAALAAVLTLLSLTGILWLNERRRRLRDKLAAREALHQAYLELERKVKERTADLSRANQQLQEEVSERIRAEQHLRQTQDNLVQAGKLAVLGQLATGVAHELNQPLAALRTLSGNAIKFLERQQPDITRSNLHTICQLVDKMGEITSALKGYARKSTNSLGQVAIEHAIDNALLLLRNRLENSQVQIIRPDAPEPWQARCDPNRFEQVLVNLLANALDELQERPQPYIEISGCCEHAQLKLQIRDNGPGLQDTVLNQLFEPFVTTKPAGIGLGLGLTLSAGIIAETGGTLSAENHPQGGAVFTITLPLVTEEERHV